MSSSLRSLYPSRCHRSPRLYTLLAVCLTLAPSQFVGAQALAQDDEGGQATRVTQPSPQPLNDLKSALPYVDWEARTHGPLIAITPDKVKWPPERVSHDNDTAEQASAADDDPLLPLKDNRGINAEKVARHFGRRLIRYATMSIYAPPTMIVLNSDLRPADPLLGADTDDKLRRLGATLSDGQWAMLGSAQGLGYGDMSKEQQALFDNVLPEKMTLNRETVKQYNGGYIGSEQVSGSERTLNPTQRLSVRLHLTRQASFNLVDAKDNQLPMSSPFHAEPIGSQKTSLSGEITTLENQSTFFKQQIRFEVPNKLKPSDLDLKQSPFVDTYVPLTGVKTVGDMIKAASKATGIELHADDRLARLPVYLSTEARLVYASDLLEGLCYALTATYRKVGPVPGGDPKDFAYVLTYDRVGLTITRGQISAWMRRGKALRQQNSNKYGEAIKKLQPGQHMQYTKSDALAPTDGALQSLQSAKIEQASRIYDEDDPNSYYSYGQPTVSIGMLTAEQRQQMVEGLKQFDKMHVNNPDMPGARTDRVSMSTSFGLSYLIPGAGEVKSDASIYDNGEMDPEDPEIARRQKESQKIQEQKAYRKEVVEIKRGPVAQVPAVLCIAPKTVEAAEPVLTAARSLGFSEVWVEVPNSSEGLRLLAGCVAAGKAHGVPVGARVALIHEMPADASAKANAEDLNVYGETESEWAADVKRAMDGIDRNGYYYQVPQVDKRDALAPEAAEARRLLTTWVGDVAKVPGLSAIVLHEAANPGHDWSAENHDYTTWSGTTFGYTVANRLAFLRSNGYDPIDFDDKTNDWGDDWELRSAVKVPRFDTKGEEDVVGYYNYDYDQAKESDKTKKPWDAYRLKTESDLLTGLRESVAKDHPLLKVYLGSYDSDGENWAGGNYLEWKAGERVPFSAPPTDTAAKKKLLVTSPASTPAKSELLLHINVSRDFLSWQNGSGEEGAKRVEVENTYPELKNATPGAYMASFIRQALKYASFDSTWNNGRMQKKPKPEPKGIVLDMTTVPSENILKTVKGALAPIAK